MAFRNSWRGTGRSIARFACYWVATFFVAVVHWLNESFGPTTLPQLLYYMRYSEGLLSETDGAFLVTFCLECLLAPTLIAALALSIERYIDTSFVRRAMQTLRLHTISSHRSRVAFDRRVLPYSALAIGFVFFLWSLSAFAYVRSMFGADQFSKKYVEPAGVAIQSRAPKNLVLIYVESLEGSYSDKNYFGEDLLAELSALPGAGFDSYVPAPGSDSTIAAMVATQCGIPLQYVISVAHAFNDQFIESFLPRATCLGDILERFGYRNVFLGGAHLQFSGKGKFLERHGYREIYGWRELQQTGAAAGGFNAWGLFDDDLLRVAKAKLLELNAGGRPFNLTILTLDTHQPHGHYSKFCLEHGAKDFEGILRCTSRLLADFINFAAEHDLMRNTSFVVVGDHLARANPVSDKLKADSRRRMFNKFIAQNLPAKNREVVTPFDLFPSMLQFIGFDVVGDRLGLGCSAFYEMAPRCQQAKLSDDFLGELSASSTYRKLWQD